MGVCALKLRSTHYGWGLTPPPRLPSSGITCLYLLLAAMLLQVLSLQPLLERGSN